MAKENQTDVGIIDLFDAGMTDEELAERNTHGAPLEAIQRMRARWQKKVTQGTK